MAHPTYQLAVDIRDQLTVAQVAWQDQPMVETQELRDAFAARLNEALDDKPGVRKGRGRNKDLQELLKIAGLDKSVQATSKWLRGDSLAEKDNVRFLADWLGVRAEWLEYGVMPKHFEPSYNKLADLVDADTGIDALSGPEIRARISKETTDRATSLLQMIDSPRSKTAIERIVEAASTGALTELDMVLLEQIAERFSGGKQTIKPAGVNEKIARKVKDAPKNPH